MPPRLCFSRETPRWVRPRIFSLRYSIGRTRRLDPANPRTCACQPNRDRPCQKSKRIFQRQRSPVPASRTRRERRRQRVFLTIANAKATVPRLVCNFASSAYPSEIRRRNAEMRSPIPKPPHLSDLPLGVNVGPRAAPRPSDRDDSKRHRGVFNAGQNEP